MARLYPDGFVENAHLGHTISRYDDVPFDYLKYDLTYTGYSANGKKETNIETLEGLRAGNFTDTAPYRPLYYGGFLQDQIERDDFTLDLGVRLEVFDNNTRILRHPYSLWNIERAGAFQRSGYIKPNNVGDEWGILFQDGGRNNAIVGFRDLAGNYYDATGAKTTLQQITDANFAFVNDESLFNDNVFKQYAPVAMLLPRISLEYRVAGHTQLSASYAMNAQRPTANFTSLHQYLLLANYNIGSLENNNALTPMRNTEYQLGVTQLLPTGMQIGIRGVHKQSKNLVGQSLARVFPSARQLVNLNDEFSTYKGVLLSVKTKNTNGLQLNAHYTLASVEGNYAIDRDKVLNYTTPDAPPKNLIINRLDFDQRHNLNAILSYQALPDRVPNFLKNVSIATIFIFKSGNPYSKQNRAYDRANPSFLGEDVVWIVNGYNTTDAPSMYRFDLKAEKQFRMHKSGGITLFVETQNLLNRANLVSVFPATGQPDNDGYLSQGDGISKYPEGTIRRDLYEMFIQNGRNNYGMPRLIRGGLRWDW